MERNLFEVAGDEEPAEGLCQVEEQVREVHVDGGGEHKVHERVARDVDNGLLGARLQPDVQL